MDIKTFQDEYKSISFSRFHTENYYLIHKFLTILTITFASKRLLGFLLVKSKQIVLTRYDTEIGGNNY